ncbi:MAG: tetratricopeptide repeat protein, partial [Planctomycetota bacterium]
MKGRKKPNKWVTAIAVIVSVVAIYLAFSIGRGIYYNNLGTAHLAEGEYDRAISCFGKALKVKRKFPEAYCNRGTAYCEKGEYDQAVADLDKAIELNPEFADAYYNRAVACFHRKQYDKAWDDVYKA